MEACGGAQHWARELTKLGHQVRLLSPRFVKAFNIGNKSDAADARAIWLAVQQPGKHVTVKTETQQAVLAMHRVRERLLPRADRGRLRLVLSQGADAGSVGRRDPCHLAGGKRALPLFHRGLQHPDLRLGHQCRRHGRHSHRYRSAAAEPQKDLGSPARLIRLGAWHWPHGSPADPCERWNSRIASPRLSSS